MTASVRARLENSASAAANLADRCALIRDVERRALPVLALLDRRVWPYAELGTLTTFLRDEVLRRASGGHARLLTLTVQLERVHGEPCPSDRARGLIDELSAALREQVHDEKGVPAAAPKRLARTSASTSAS